jgi:hypothetical protein
VTPSLDANDISFFQQLIPKCMHNPDSDGSDCNLSHMQDWEVTGVWRIENKVEWDLYAAKRQKLMKKLGAEEPPVIPPPPVDPPLWTADWPEFVKREKWELRAGEAYLFHGSPSESEAMDIAENGFNRHFANSKGMFGSGCYFTDQFCKAAFYAHREAQKKRGAATAVLVCRVSMGHHFQVQPDGVERDATRAPRKCQCEGNSCRCGKYYDSVVAHTRVQNGGVVHGEHREIVVYDSEQVYPEFMIFLRPLPGGGKAGSAAQPAIGGPSAASGSGGGAQVRRAMTFGWLAGSLSNRLKEAC